MSVDTENVSRNSSISESPLSANVSKLSKRKSLKIQKQSYRLEKKKPENELKETANNPAVILLSDWLKVRSTLKNWSRVWCVLKPGMLIFYKNSKQKQCVGTVLLTSVEIIERPSKKDGFCFKVFHAFNQSIWAKSGVEISSLLSSSLPTSYLILRAQTESDGQCWLDALELARKCSNLLKKSLEVKSPIKSSNSNNDKNLLPVSEIPFTNFEDSVDLAELQHKLTLMGQGQLVNTIDNVSFGGSSTISENEDKLKIGEDRTDTDSSCTSTGNIEKVVATEDLNATEYISDVIEVIGNSTESAQTGEIADENKSIVWTLLKQLRPGMDLSKVVLPTFILEPRSFLDKLSDYYYHSDLLSSATKLENPFKRMKKVTQWYLSGFYKKPKGLKKPYNPILGETFRCKWDNPDTNSSTFYIAEQVSHHPPISAFVVSNRLGGFLVNGSILSRSKFYGNSISAILDGTAKILLLKQGEEYCATMPYAHCKGILYGKMTLEFGGKVFIKCEKTGYTTELEFKLKPMFGSGRMNEISGRILFGNRVLATLSGYWDQEVHITNLKEGSVEQFWSPTAEIKKARLKRSVVEMDKQGEFESQYLWRNVTKAINDGDQIKATEEKSILEEAQRKSAKTRKENETDWKTKYFQFDSDCKEWVYEHTDARPWDDLNDILQYEKDGVICTKTKHKTSPVKTTGRSPSLMGVLGHESCSRSFSSSTSLSTETPNSKLQDKYAYAKIFNEFQAALSPIANKQTQIVSKLEDLETRLRIVSIRLEENSNFSVINWIPALVSIFISILIFYMFN